MSRTFEIDEVAEEVSYETALNRQLRAGEYVVLPNRENIAKIPRSILTNSLSKEIKTGYEYHSNEKVVYGVLPDVSLFGPYQTIRLKDGRFLNEFSIKDEDHFSYNCLFAERY